MGKIIDKTWTRVVCVVLWFVAGALLANMIGVGIAAVNADFFSKYGEVIIYPIMFVPAFIYFLVESRNGNFYLGDRPLDDNNVKPLGWITCIVLVAIATLSAAYICDPIVKLLPPMPEWLKQAMDSIMNQPLWLTLISVSVFAPLCEEWLCRGIVLRALLEKMHPAWAIALSGLFFSIIHLNPWQGIPAFVLGCLFGWVYYRTGSLKLTMLMHCVNNTFSACLSHVDSLKDMDSFMDAFPEVWMFWIIFAACVVMAAFCIYELRKVKPAYIDWTPKVKVTEE